MDFKIVILCLLIGAATGLRTMTGLAVMSGTAFLGWINLKQSPLALLGSLPAALLLTAGAFGEFIADKLPRTGARTAPGPLIVRMTAGGFCGAAVCFASGQAWGVGVALGVLGALLGTFGGYYARAALVRKLQASDFLIALPEDLVAIGLAVLVVLAL